MNGIISVLASGLVVVLAFLFGYVNKDKATKAKAETVQAKAEAQSNVKVAETHKVEATLATKTAEAVVKAQKAETERVLTSAEIEDKLQSAMQSGDQSILLELAGQMAQRAQERINNRK